MPPHFLRAGRLNARCWAQHVMYSVACHNLAARFSRAEFVNQVDEPTDGSVLSSNLVAIAIVPVGGAGAARQLDVAGFDLNRTRLRGAAIDTKNADADRRHER